MSEDQFCPHCDVTMDLHDGPDSCDHAGHKARMLEMLQAAIFGARP